MRSTRHIDCCPDFTEAIDQRKHTTQSNVYLSFSMSRPKNTF